MNPSSTVFVVEWEEFDKAFGPSPDGFSAHTSEEKMNSFIKKYDGVDDPSTTITAMPVRIFSIESEALYQLAKNAGGSKKLDSREFRRYT